MWGPSPGSEQGSPQRVAVRRPLRVAMLLSGGVDSSLALRLLVAAGHNVTAFYLQIWFQEDFRWGRGARRGVCLYGSTAVGWGSCQHEARMHSRAGRRARCVGSSARCGLFWPTPCTWRFHAAFAVAPRRDGPRAWPLPLRNFWDACPWEEDLEYAQKVSGS